MKTVAASVASAISLLFVATAALPESSTHWTYEGHEGPEHWGELTEDFAICASGQEQSPINLSAAVMANATALEIDWHTAARWTVVNNGHTIQANAEDGGAIVIGDTRYELLQLHFHHPSEHALNSEILPMEAHFVHRADNGALAVVGVMIESGGHNTMLDAIVRAAPSPLRVEGVGIGAADPAQFLPQTRSFYRYQGSLTTPPCSETVLWTVLQQPLQVDQATIDSFAALFENNARPVQERHRRYLLSSN